MGIVARFSVGRVGSGQAAALTQFNGWCIPRVLGERSLMPFNWSVSWKELADGSKLVKLTRTEYGLSRRTSRTVSYRLPPGEAVPKYNYQFERAWKRATESPAQRDRREARAAKVQEDQARRAVALKAAPRRARMAYNTGCGMLVIAALAAVGLIVAGFVVLFTNRCGFFLQFPPAGCAVASIAPPGAAPGWHLIFGALGAGLVVLLIGKLVAQSLTERGNQQAREDAQEAARRNNEEQRRVRDAMSQYLAEFRAQGYAAEPAEALARKRLRDEGPSQRVWSAADVENERGEVERQQQAAAAALGRKRELAERQQKIDAGELACCPQCQQYAPASQGVILAHSAGSNATPCEGEGMGLGDT